MAAFVSTRGWGLAVSGIEDSTSQPFFLTLHFVVAVSEGRVSLFSSDDVSVLLTAEQQAGLLHLAK